MSAPSNDLLFVVVFVVPLVLFVFLVCRELVCWYWKVNMSVKLLDDLVALQRKIVDIQLNSNEKLESICVELAMIREQQEKI